MNGVKYDHDKLDYSLLPDSELEPVVRVLMFGAKKYAPDNWKRVDDASRRYYNAAMRHLMAWRRGEQADPETGESHIAHAICCLLFLSWFDRGANQSGAPAKPVQEPGKRVAESMCNTYLFDAACLWYRAGHSSPEVLSAVLRENRHVCVPPLDEAEIGAIVSRAHRRVRFGDTGESNG